MKFKNTPLLFLLLAFALPSVASSTAKNKKVVYKSHTELDFTGEKIEGKVKAPAVFYIFQRKRSMGHEISRSPDSLHFHDEEMKKILKENTRE